MYAKPSEKSVEISDGDYEIEIDNVEQLIALCKETEQEIIIAADGKNRPLPELKIYDDYYE